MSNEEKELNFYIDNLKKRWRLTIYTDKKFIHIDHVPILHDEIKRHMNYLGIEYLRKNKKNSVYNGTSVVKYFVEEDNSINDQKHIEDSEYYKESKGS